MSKIQSFAGINTNDYIELKDYTRRPNSFEKVSKYVIFALYLVSCNRTWPDQNGTFFRRESINLTTGAGPTLLRG